MDDNRRDVDMKFQDPLSVELVKSEYEIFLRVPIGLAWEKIIDGMDSWWMHRFKPGSRVVIDPRVMGRWEELFDDKGNGALYGMVTYCDPPNAFACVGQWGMFGAINSGGIWKLTEKDGGTLLSTRGEMMGHITKEMLSGREDGTVGLLRCLRHWVEDDIDWRQLQEMNK